MAIQTKCAIRAGDLLRFLAGVHFKIGGRQPAAAADGVSRHSAAAPAGRADGAGRGRRSVRPSAEIRQGKRWFGVSNHNPMQIELLNQYCGGKICIDQIQFSAAHCPTIDAGLNVNIHNDAGCSRDGSLIEYARLKKLTLQAWSPFQYGMFEGIFIGNEKFPELNKVLDELSEKYGVTQNAIATAWILRHPAGIQTIVGSTNLKRIQDISKAADITLTREEWYRVYLAAGKLLP